MKSVNPKSKSKSKTGPQPPATPWFRFSFHFTSAQACNRCAMPVARSLRIGFQHLYFARYTNAIESRLDVIIHWQCTLNTHELMLDHTSAMAKGCEDVRWTHITGPFPCEGSFAHAAAFEFALRFWTITVDSLQTVDDQKRFELWNDTLHWAHNMVGYDYTDEAKCHLHSLGRIITIFESSIRLGNQMFAAQKKAARKTRKPSNN